MPADYCSRPHVSSPSHTQLSAPPSPALTEHAAPPLLTAVARPHRRKMGHGTVPLSSPPRPLLSLSLSAPPLAQPVQSTYAQAPAAGKNHRAAHGFRRARAQWSRREERPELLRRFPSFPDRFSAQVEPAASSSPTAAAVSTLLR